MLLAHSMHVFMRLWAASAYVWTPARMAKEVYGDQCEQLFSLHFKRRSVVGAAALRQASREGIKG